MYSSIESASSLLREYKALTWILMGLQIQVGYRAIGATFEPSHDQIDSRSNSIELPDEGSGEVKLYNDLIA